MIKPICRISARASPVYNILYFRQIRHFSSSLTPVPSSPNQDSFTVTYLTNTYGFTSEQALSASKYVKFETPDKPDSVVAFFKNHGFTQTQILRIITKFPPVLRLDAQKKLLPKLEFLYSKGISSTDVATILSTSPTVLQRSLENIIIPSFNFVSALLQSEDKTIAVMKRYSGIFLVDHQTHLLPMIEILRGAGVPGPKIVYLLTRQPRTFMTSIIRFREIVEEVEKIGFNPLRSNFVLAVHVLRAMVKSTWDKKLEAYKKWGLTDDEFFAAFKKYPWCMKVSENKIHEVMDFLVNKMGSESSFFVRRPDVVSLSLKKRIVPRNAVYQALLSKGFIKKNVIGFDRLLLFSEKQFLEKVLSYNEKEAPELLKLYKEKLDLAK